MGCTVTVDMEMPAWQLHSLTSQQRDVLVEKLKTHQLFDGMDKIALEAEITKVIERKTFIQEETLFQTKYDGTGFIYFISCGKFKMISVSSPMNKIQANIATEMEKGSGDIIGELDNKRGVVYNLKCLSESAEVLRISRRDYDEIKDRSIARQKALCRDVIACCSLFKDLSTEAIQKLQSVCNTKKIVSGETLTEKDAPGKVIYLVIANAINNTELERFNITEPEVQYCSIGTELVSRDNYENTIVAIGDSLALVLDLSQVETLLQERIGKALKINSIDQPESEELDQTVSETSEHINLESHCTDINEPSISELDVCLENSILPEIENDISQITVKVIEENLNYSVDRHTPTNKDSRIVAPIVAAIEAHLLVPIEYPVPAPTDFSKNNVASNQEPVKIGAVQGSVSWKNSFHISSSEASFTDGESLQQSAKSFPLNCNSEDDHKFILQMSQLQLQAGYGSSINRYNSWGVGSNYHKDEHAMQSQTSKLNVLELENDENGKPWIFRD